MMYTPVPFKKNLLLFFGTISVFLEQLSCKFFLVLHQASNKAPINRKITTLHICTKTMLESQHRRFSVKIAEFLRAPILKKICEWMLLKYDQPNQGMQHFVLWNFGILRSFSATEKYSFNI